MYQTYQLKNKVTVHMIPVEDTRSATVLIMYPVGSRYETEKLRGVSHYIEHLMFKGTKKRKNTLVLTREIDRLGAEYNAFTGKEYTGYYIKADTEYLGISLDILSDMVFNSVFDPKEMEREKGPIIEEIRMYNDNPFMNIDNIFEDVLYKGSRLGQDIAGTEAHVRGYKRADVLAYKKKYYQPSNMHVIIAGKIDEAVKGNVQKYFGNKRNTQKPIHTYTPHRFGSSQKTQRIAVQQKKTDQAQLMLGFPGFPHTHRSNATLSVLNTILGGSMSSRLFIKIRERLGLAYMVRCGAERFQDTGYVYVRAGLEAKNINKAIQAIRLEIEKIMKNGVTKRELADAKTHIRGSLTLSLEDSSAQANWYAKQILFSKKVENPDKKLKRIERVSGENIQHVARSVFDFKKMRVGIIGDVPKDSVHF